MRPALAAIVAASQATAELELTWLFVAMAAGLTPSLGQDAPVAL